MLFGYGNGCLFNHDKKSVVAHISQHGFDLEKIMSADAEIDLREMLGDAFRNFEGEISQSVDFVE